MMRPPLYNALLVLAFILLSGSLVFLLYVWPKQTEPTAPLKENLTAQSAVGDGTFSYLGTILSQESPDGIADGRLIDDQGRTLAYLRSGRIDLRILRSGLKVLVEGKREKIMEGNLPLISVDKLSFR